MLTRPLLFAPSVNSASLSALRIHLSLSSCAQ